MAGGTIMEQAKYTSKEIKEANAFLQILDGVPQNKRFILALVADAFINGMNAQEQLTAGQPGTRKE